MTAYTTEQPPEPDTWPRLGALATIPGRPGVWSIWSRGHDWKPRHWWLVPVDATEEERAKQAELLHDTEFTRYAPDEQEALL